MATGEGERDEGINKSDWDDVGDQQFWANDRPEGCTDMRVFKYANSAFHPSIVNKLSTIFSWDYSRNVAYVGWQVKLRDRRLP